MEQYPNILGEFNFKLEKDVNNKKLVFLDQYLKENKISAADYKIGYLPLLMAFNQNSTSTPAHLVQCPNHPGICIYPKPTDSLQQEGQSLEAPADLINCEDGTPFRPKCLSYNDCINNYNLSLLTPNKITVNHLLSMAPILGDISDPFGHNFLDPQKVLSCKIFLHKSKEDSLPLWT